MTERTSEAVTSQIVEELSRRLEEAEDAETAIAVYKMADRIIALLQQIQASALDLAKKDMRRRDLQALKTPVGSAGWAEPRSKQLNERAWNRALASNPNLREIKRDFEVAQATLRQVQVSYQEASEDEFFIR